MSAVSQLSETYLERVVSVDIAREYRDRALMLFCFALPPFVLPFTAISFLHDRPVMGALTAAVVAIALIDALALMRGRRMPLPVPVLWLAVVVTLVYGFHLIGAPATYWCYPAPLIFVFVETRTAARVMNGLFVLTVIPTALWLFDFALASRFAVTLAMVCLFSEVLVNLVVELQSKLTELARVDPLTGAYNRRHMDERLVSAIEEMRRGRGPSTLVSFDIDRFKLVNDSLGHDAGDGVLKALADVARDAQRKVDTLFRTGGEEFSVLLPDTPLDGGLVFADALREQVETAELLPGRTITISLGVAQHLPDESQSEWLKRADRHLYEAKQAGRNCVRPAV